MQCALLANSAGIGGGPFYVPLFNVVLGFDLKLCTGLSHTVVAISAIASTFYGIYQVREINAIPGAGNKETFHSWPRYTSILSL